MLFFLIEFFSFNFEAPPSFTDTDRDDKDMTSKDESMGQYHTNSERTDTATNNLVNKHATHLHHNHHNNQNKNHHSNTQKFLHHSTSSSTKSISIVEGTSIELECNAFGIPKPDINWYVKRFDTSTLTGKSILGDYYWIKYFIMILFLKRIYA